jgi:hypothetical protein
MEHVHKMYTILNKTFPFTPYCSTLFHFNLEQTSLDMHLQSLHVPHTLVVLAMIVTGLII